MKKEYKYFGAVFSIFLFSILALGSLLGKFTPLALGHFIETCRQITKDLISPGVHYVGFLLIVTTLLVTITFFLKTIFSFTKTQKKVKQLSRYRLDKTPIKFRRALSTMKLKEDDVVVIERRLDHAFSYGLRSRKIMISTGIIGKLSSKQLEAVLLHEQYHSQNKHPLLIAVSEVLSSSLFFLPFLKEITGKMRVVFENQADNFIVQTQGTDKHLRLALVKVSNNSFGVHPNFLQRRKYVFSRAKILLSSFTVIIVLGLFLIPSDSLASQKVSYSRQLIDCEGYQCSTHCLSGGTNESSVATSIIQNTAVFASY